MNEKFVYFKVGYSALVPTRLRYSHRFRNLSASFALFDAAFGPSTNNGVQQQADDDGGLHPWYTTEWPRLFSFS
jgi:hypothetical protein